MDNLTKLYVVVPCYNECEVFPETEKQLSALFDRMESSKIISSDSKIVFVDDGSKDNTWELITSSNRTNKWVQGVKLSRNQGHQ
ncbi:MAG: glycosyltransferase, partial [Clostridia bacterium]|nr:glycosyltransferase [Clostridia bacterium]